MKKLFAVLLALCLLLAAVPALAEDFSGLWHLVLAEVDLGYFQLNEDGTLSGDLIGAGEVTGTWKVEEDLITITIDGDTLPFTWDGTMLWSEDLMIPVVREEGRVSSDVMSAYFGGMEYELPEGMTTEEIEQIGLNFQTQYAKILQDMNAREASATAAPAASELTVDIISENFYVIESYSGYRGVWLAEVMNLNQGPVYVRSGSLTVKDADGNVVGTASYLSDRGSVYLEPGETTFLSMEADMAEKIEATCEKTLEVKGDPYRIDINLTAGDSDFTIAEGEYETSWVQTTVTNETENPVGVSVIFALEDAEGKPWFVEETSLYRHQLTPGSSIVMIQTLDERTRNFLKENNIQITTVKAYTWNELD